MTNASGNRGRYRSAPTSGIASAAAPNTARAETPAIAPAPASAPGPAPAPSAAAGPAASAPGAPQPAGGHFIVVWQFEVADHNIAAFESAYSSGGDWARLFRTSPDYSGTELLRDAYIPGVYLTIDRWASEDAFRAFRRDHDADYEKLDRQCDSLTTRETRIGAYTG